MLISLLILFFGLEVIAQDTLLTNFSVTIIENSVKLNWTIKKGNTSQGIRILRSSDSLNFSEIGDFAGLCGSLGEETNYSFTDRNPIRNATGYYRLELGLNGLSDIKSIKLITIPEDGINVFPVPSLENITIAYSNIERNQLDIKILNVNGELIEHLRTKKESVTRDLMNYEPGVYFILVTDQDNVESAPRMKSFIKI